VVVLQEVGAVLGLLLGLAAVTATEVTDDPVWDGMGGIAIGSVLGLVSVVLLGQIRSLLIGRSGTRKDVEAITAAFEIDPAVRRVVSLHTRHQGPDELLVGARVELDHELSFPEVAEVVHRIERNVRRAVPIARSMYIEPDVPEERRAAPAVEHHQPGHDLPPDIRARLDAEARRGSLGEHIVVEDDLPLT
jgi:divalent metal cation (Fe/Co/Zn/Cd) transporter